MGIAAVGLVASGVPLLWLYRPQGMWLKDLHSLASTLFFGAAAGLLVAAVVSRLAKAGASEAVVWPAGLTVLAVLGAFTGRLLAWDQLGLWAVTIGKDYRGALRVRSSEVRFAILDGARINPGEYQRWLAVHIVALPVLALGLGVVSWRRRSASRAKNG